MSEAQTNPQGKSNSQSLICSMSCLEVRRPLIQNKQSSLTIREEEYEVAEAEASDEEEVEEALESKK